MGWSSGVELAEEIWRGIKPYIKINNYKDVTKVIVDAFNRRDADDWEWYLDQNGSLYQMYLKLNAPEEYQEYLEEVNDD